MADTRSATRRRLVLPSALPYARVSGVGFVALLVVAVEIFGRPTWLDPATFMPVAVLAGAAIGGVVSGAFALAVGGPYLLLYYSQPAQAATSGGLGNVVASILASGACIGICWYLSDRGELERAQARAAARRSNLVTDFASLLANEQVDELPTALVHGTADLVAADMVVLTVLDPPSGRHYVRATHGGSNSAVGVEVLPGVGITGQAIRERRSVVSAGPDVSSTSGLTRRLRGGSGGAHAMAAVACLQAGRVIASLTVGRNEGPSFSSGEQKLLDAIGSLVTLAVAGSLVRSEGEQGSPRDQLTALYNRAYLDASLEQIIALRRRTRPEERPPLSLIMFDIDSFGQINEKHGRQVGDAVLRAVATILRQRFRASDIVARVGGDSFFVVLNGATADIAGEAAAHIRRQVRELNLANLRGEPVSVSISAGCAAFHDGEKPEALFRSVEAALETARWSGPGAVVSI